MPTQGTKAPAFLSTPAVEFEDGTVVSALRPLTDYRTCHEGRPHEARIVYACESQLPSSSSSSSHILKVKVQVPGPGSSSAGVDPSPPPPPAQRGSDTTALEIEALRTFRDADARFAPQLLGFTSAVQDGDGPLPGGYVTYLLMTKMRGETLFDSGFWGRGEAEREEITGKFLDTLRAIHRLGIQPLDRALRNVIWDEETRTCSIIDFEMWKATDGIVLDETKELQRWGLARCPPQKWWDIWFDAERG